MIRDARGIGTPFRRGDQRVREGLGKAVREHPCPCERGGERLETQVAAERGTELRDLLGAAEYLRSRQHVRAVVPVCVVGEQRGHGGLGDVPLVDDGRTGGLRARDDLARRQLPLPATGVGGQCVAPQHHGAQPGAVEQGFHVRVHLDDRIALARGRVVDGGRGEVDEDEGRRRRGEFRDQAVGGGGIEQGPRSGRPRRRRRAPGGRQRGP
ncbi:hypothetical protein ACWDR5_04150 [Streptomyces koyangensis]